MPRSLLIVLIFFNCLSCSLLKEQKEPQPDVKSVIQKPLSPEKSEELLGEVGDNWLFGQGMGETALTAGTIIVFPPYAIYVLANGILSVSGYETIHFTDALPDEERETWNDAYDTVTSAPGHLSAALAGREFRTKEVAKEKINDIIHSGNEKTQNESK